MHMEDSCGQNRTSVGSIDEAKLDKTPHGEAPLGQEAVGNLDKGSIENPVPRYSYLHLQKDGWFIAKIHMTRDWYEMVGFLENFKDFMRLELKKNLMRQETKLAVKPQGWRGFNPFKKS